MKELDEPQRRLRDNLQSKAYREPYATNALIDNVSAQVQVLRRQRGFTQEELARLVRTKQPRISNVENPRDSDHVPNWELDTLNRIAQALGTRLKISFETYGSLVDELHSITSDSLRRPEAENDPILFPRPDMPGPDPDAPERIRWMQELMIPWLWTDELGLDRLIGWLQGNGLPPVGHDEEPYHWLLRGIPADTPIHRDYMQKQLAERLAILLSEEPDVHPLIASNSAEFLSNLYWTCAGLNRPAFLAEPLWQAYKRLKHSKLSGAVKDALQAAIVQNQPGDKALREIWEPMVEQGRHRWLRGSEIVGYEGILVRHQTVKQDLSKILWALGKISHRWQGTHGDRIAFRRMIERIPDLKRSVVANRLIETALTSENSWSPWALACLPTTEETKSRKGSVEEIRVVDGQTEYFVATQAGNSEVLAGVRNSESRALERSQRSALSNSPDRTVLWNHLGEYVGNLAETKEAEILGKLYLVHAVIYHVVRQYRRRG